MLERTTRSFEDFLQDHDLVSLENKRGLRRKSDQRINSEKSLSNDGEFNAERSPTMTRKTRTRRPRIAVIQSGYCAVCNLPYNNVEDHVQSKKHQKLIGEDANYIALNGSLNGFLHTNDIGFLNLNGIDAIGVHDSSLEDFSPKHKRKNMSKQRAASVVHEKIKPSPLSPTGSDTIGHHHLRSRRNINYRTPPLDDDSYQETPNASPEREPQRVFKEYRELRSSTRALAKLTGQIQDTPQDEVWNSGRPKRACLRQKRHSLDHNSYKDFYVMKSKIKIEEKEKTPMPQSPKYQKDDKSLVNKFKKQRNTELVQLNNEATNFLFPKKSGETSRIEHEDYKKTENINSNNKKNTVFEDTEFKYEDEASTDSTCSSGKKGKKRRTHAEAFILDNQKYYKFEMPGSRLRYQGTYLPPIIKSPKRNGECEEEEKEEDDEPEEKKVKTISNMQLDKYEFSFEKISDKTMKHKKTEEEQPPPFNHYFWDSFVLPYQMARIKPLDPKLCVNNYNQFIKKLNEAFSDPEENSLEQEQPGLSESSSSVYESALEDDNSKLSTFSSSESTEEKKGKKSRAEVVKNIEDKNPRKSPRQHASTLAILSSLIQQRKKRSKATLPTIAEESQSDQSLIEDTDKDDSKKRLKTKADYLEMIQKIEKELDAVLDENLEQLDIEIIEEDNEEIIDFHNSKTSVTEIIKLLEETKLKDEKNSIQGRSGKKPNRKRKKNLTGWPNKSRKVSNKHGNVRKNCYTSSDTESDVERSPKRKVLTNKVLQPFVCVKKLDESNLKESKGRRNKKKVLTSPRSPRVLRRPRGRWYRER